MHRYEQVDGAALDYDLTGNLLTDGRNSYTYDVLNRQISIIGLDNTAEYVYDALGRRVAKIVDGVTTYYVYNAGYQVIEERGGSNQLLARYTYGAGIDEPLTMERGSQTYYYHRDALGSMTEITDASGALVERYEYDVYGAVKIFDTSGNPLTASAIGNPYLFTGRRYDPESGNYYYRARIYSPTLGRFLQTDPLGYLDGLNLYTYVGNNPASWVDPLGLWFGFDDVITGPVDELLVLGYVFCRATGGCELPPIRDMLPDWTDYSPPPYPAYRVPGPDPMIFVPADEAARQNIPGSPSPEACPTPDPGPLVNPIPGDDPVFDPRIIDPFPGNDPVFDPVTASSAVDEIKSLPEFANMTREEIIDVLVSRGYSVVPASGSGQGEPGYVWTKAMPDGTTAVIRIDPVGQRTQASGKPVPRDWAAYNPHAHKETVATSSIDKGNYEFFDDTIVKFTDEGRIAREEDFTSRDEFSGVIHIPLY